MAADPPPAALGTPGYVTRSSPWEVFVDVNWGGLAVHFGEGDGPPKPKPPPPPPAVSPAGMRTRVIKRIG
jgi:hypothetical protein